MAGSITFTPTAADYLATQRSSWRRQLASRRFRVRLPLVLLVFFAVGVGASLATGDRWHAALLVGLGAAGGGLIGLAVVIAMTLLPLPRRSARQFRQQRTLRQPHDFAWTDEGGAWTSAVGSSRIAWEDYHGWAETRSTILLYLNETLHHFVPKRAMSEEQVADLRATLETHGPARR